jgi:class 3 adenylate cyclase
MEPQIQYAKTSDGVNIAFWTMGEGSPPLVHLPSNAFGHIQREWDIPESQSWCEQLARGRMLVRYDSRGQGMSDRDVEDYSGPGFVRDLSAVLRKLGLDSCALFGPQHSGPIAMAYAATYPERVSHLVLWCTWARGADAAAPELHGLGRLMEANWQLYAEAVAHALFGWSEGEKAHEFASVVKESITYEGLKAFMRAAIESDVTPLLHQIRAKTLILHRRGVPLPDLSVARKLASQIPDARLLVLEGTPVVPWLGDTDSVVAAIDEFLGAKAGSTLPRQSLPSSTAIILFIDIAGSTALTTQIGDAAYREKERQLDGALRQAIREAGGSPVEGKVLGDGVMAVFSSASNAIDAALRCQALGAAAGLPLHTGLHAGDVIREANNVHGGAVQVAARIADASEPGEVLVSQTVRDLARTSAGVAFEDRGERELKGVAEPVRVWVVRGGGEA